MPQYSAFLKALGIAVEPNQLSVAPGSLVAASDVIIRRDNVVEPRRGFQLYGTPFGTSTDVASQVLEYQNRLIVNYDDILLWDTQVENTLGQSIFNTFAGSYPEVVPGLRMKSVQANNNLYFTTANGVMKISSMTGNDFTTAANYITPSGGIQALDITTRLAVTYGSTSGFLPNDSAVAYRVVWGYNDANNNLILGTPSSPSIIYNSLAQMNVRDLNALLYALDQLDIPGSTITAADFVATYGLPLDASDLQVVTNLEALTIALDTVGTWGSNPTGQLFSSSQIISASITTGVCTIDIIDDVGIFGKVSVGDIIFLSGFTPTSGTLEGTQTVTDVEVTDSQQVTTITTTAASTLASSGTASNFIIYNANNVVEYYVWYDVSSGTTDPAIGGAVGIEVNVLSTDGPSVVAANTVAAINQFVTDFTATSLSNVITITNVNSGSSTDAADGSPATTFTFATPVPGSTIMGTISFATTATGSVTLSSPYITSGWFEGIAQPPTPASPPTDADLTATQTYLNNIILELQSDHNLRQVAAYNGVPAQNPLDITTAAITGGTTLTINFDLTVPLTDAGNQFEVGDLIELPGTWTATGGANISGVYTVASLGPSVPYSYITITLPSAHTNGAVTIDNTSTIQQILRFTDAIQSTYLSFLTVTTTANVYVDITVPPGATLNTFYQIYRGTIIQATGTDVLSNLVPDDEMVQVYEGYPTQAQLNAGVITVLDETPDSFTVGAVDLYTNEISGQGILQANNPPPLAQDINIFQNYTWYANTSTLQRLTLNLLGVSQIITDYEDSLNPSIVITNGDITNEYAFVLGVAQVTLITTGAGSTLATSGPGSYFTLSGANNTDQYYFWYSIGTTTDPGISDPSLAGYTGVEIFALASDSANTIASKTTDRINTIVDDFMATVSGATITVTNIGEGPAATPGTGTSGFGISVTTPGAGQNVTHEITQFTIIAGSLYVTSGTADYFTLNTPFDRETYAFWYNVSGGTMIAPVITGATVLPINILSGDSAATVATKTAAAISATGFWTTSVASNILTTTNVSPGPTVHATDHVLNVGFIVAVTLSGALDVLLSNSISPSVAVDETSRSLIQVINQNPADSVNAFYLSGIGQVPGQILFQSKKLTDIPFSIMANELGTGNSFSPSIAPSFVGLTNTAADPTVITAANHGLVDGDEVVIAGSNSTPSINGLWVVDNVTTNTFTIPVAVTVAGTTGSLINALSSSAQQSTNEVKINRLFYSKFQQPEAVPLLNYLDVGSQNKAILRIFPLRDSLFIFKEDGLFRVSGQSAPFTLTLFDSTVKLVAADSLGTANNLIYGWSKEGIVTISESGKQLISRPIDTIVLPLSSSGLYPNFSTATWGVGYESDNSYYVFTVSETTDTEATICYRYSNLTGTWTTYDKTNTCGIVKFLEDKLYLGAGDVDSIEVERKSFDRTDYADRQYIKELLPGNYFNGGATMKLDSDQHVAVGDVLVQNQTLNVYTYNALLQKLDIDPGITTPDYFATLQAFGGDNMRTDLENLAAKLDAEPGFSGFEALIVDQISYPIISNSNTNPTIITSTNHGLQTGRVIVITGNTGSVPSINGQYTVTRIDANNFSIPVNVTTPGTGGAFTTLIDDFNDIEACFNLIVAGLNASPQSGFKNFVPITEISPIEVIITGFNQFTGILTLNIPLNFVQGPIILYKAINSTFTYSPLTLNDPVGYKQIREFELYFENKTFTNATMSFATDLFPELIPVEFFGYGSGLMGNDIFGQNYFGGNSHSAPFRTYIPQQCQRCRYLTMQFDHQIAREKFSVFGVGVTARVGISGRAYRS